MNKKVIIFIACFTMALTSFGKTIIYGVPQTEEGTKHFGMSATFEAMEEIDMAIEEMQEVVKIEPSFAAGYLKLGELCGKSKEFRYRKLAAKYLDEAVQRDSQNESMAQMFRVQNEAREKIIQKRFNEKLLGEWVLGGREDPVWEYCLRIRQDNNGKYIIQVSKDIIEADEDSSDHLWGMQDVFMHWDEETNCFYVQGKDWNVNKGYRVYYTPSRQHIALAIFIPYSEDAVQDDKMKVTLYMNGNPIYGRYLTRIGD